MALSRKGSRVFAMAWSGIKFRMRVANRFFDEDRSLSLLLLGTGQPQQTLTRLMWGNQAHCQFASVPSQMFIAVALTDSDYGPVGTALHEVTAQELGHPANRCFADIAF